MDHVDLNEKGLEALEVGRYDEALEFFQKAVELNSEELAYHYNCGLALTKLNRVEEAEKKFRDAISKDKNYYNAYIGLRELFYEKEHYDKAENFYNKALNIENNDIDALTGIAKVYLVLAGDDNDELLLTDAIESLNSAETQIRILEGKGEKRVEWAETYAARAEAKCRLKDYAGGKNDFKRGRSFNPDDNRIKRNLRRAMLASSTSRNDRWLSWGGRFLALLSLAIALLSLYIYFFYEGKEYDFNAVYLISSLFVSLLFSAAGLYLPNVTKLKFGGTEIEKTSGVALTPLNIEVMRPRKGVEGKSLNYPDSKSS